MAATLNPATRPQVMLHATRPVAAPATVSVTSARRMLQMAVGSLIIAGFSTLYAVTTSPALMIAIVVVHGTVWSGLLTASGAYMAAILPASRRAEGLGYWGFASITAIGVAPSIGFAVYHLGWVALCAEMVALNLLMAFIAWRLPELPAHDAPVARRRARPRLIHHDDRLRAWVVRAVVRHPVAVAIAVNAVRNGVGLKQHCARVGVPREV